MNKILKEKLNGIITNKYVPNIYHNGQYIDEELVDIIALEIKCNNNNIKLVKPRKSKYSIMFIGDKVTLNKYLIFGDYDEYVSKVKEYIYNYNSDNPNKKNIFNNYIVSEEEFNRKPIGIIQYEIDFENNSY